MANIKAKYQLRALVIMSKFECEFKFYKKATKSVNWTQWKVMMKNEYQSLIKNKTWVQIKWSDVFSDHWVLNRKWVYKQKTLSEQLFKICWIIKEFNQQYEIDYFEIFITVAKSMSYKILLTLTAHYNLEIHQMNVKSVFLYENLNEKIYLNLSDNFQDENDEDVVCRLLKFLYDLKQASWVWVKVLREFLISHDLARLESDHCIYIEKDLIVVIYVDDILILSKNKWFLQQMKKELKSCFKMSDLESVKHYLNIEIHQIKKRICLTQTEYITDMLKHFDMKDCASKPILMNDKIQLDIDNTDKSLSEINKEHYQQVIKSLLYLSLKTRSDISLAVMILSWFTVNSHKKHEAALNRIFHYLRDILDIDIIYYAVKSLISTDFSDASYAHSIIKKDRHSMSEYIFFMTDKSVSWSCKCQSIIVTSFMKIKYIDQYNVTQENV